MSFLDDPEQDLSAQIAALVAFDAGVPALRAAHLGLTPWLSAWQSVLTQAVAEASDGLQEGQDVARQDFFAAAVRLSGGATAALARAGVASSLAERLSYNRLWLAHVGAWRALSATRQALSYAGDGWVSGRRPLLGLSDSAEQLLAAIGGDPLLGEVTYNSVTRDLNTLAGGVAWRV